MGVISRLPILRTLLIFVSSIALASFCLAQDWNLRVKPQGTLKVVDLFIPSSSAMFNYAEGLLALDKDNKWVSCLAQDWRWLDDRTIEFRLRKGVTFHNGQEFNGDAVSINWEAYKRMTRPRPLRFLVLPDETTLEIIDKYLIRFTFPKPDGLAFVRLSLTSRSRS